jgi:phospholipid-binding lipoprotein MlaA
MSLGKSALRTTFSRALIMALIGLSACATKPPASDPVALSAYQRANDPLEPMNRATFKFNLAFDAVIMRPIAITYRTVTPSFMRKAITHFLNNIFSPFILVNDLLQGRPDRGAVTVMRFITNTTVGIGGLMDPATKWGWERHQSDFGQTLGVWGVGEGVYIVLPFIGPSNPRDTIGLAAQFFGDPTSLYIEHEYGKTWSYVRTGMDVLDYRTETLDTLDELYANSSDFYAAMRSAYRQNREYRINYGKPSTSTPKDDPFATDMEDETKSGDEARPDDKSTKAAPDKPAGEDKSTGQDKPAGPDKVDEKAN